MGDKSKENRLFRCGIAKLWNSTEKEVYDWRVKEEDYTSL